MPSRDGLRGFALGSGMVVSHSSPGVCDGFLFSYQVLKKLEFDLLPMQCVQYLEYVVAQCDCLNRDNLENSLPGYCLALKIRECVVSSPMGLKGQVLVQCWWLSLAGHVQSWA